MKNILYHYSSLEVLQKILENGDENHITLWATQIKYLNDIKEYLIAIKELQKRLIDFDENLPKEQSKNFQKLLNDKRMRLFEWEEIEDDYPFIISFSKDGDNLPMWNQYADNCKGVAIGFDTQILEKLTETCSVLKLKDCVYDLNSLNDYLDQNVKVIHKSLELTSCSTSLPLNYDSKILNEFHKHLSILKHSTFFYEKETRLIYSAKNNEEPNFNLKNGIFKPYLVLKIPTKAIKEIVLGPLTSIEMLKVPIGRMMRKINLKATIYENNTDVLIRKSKCPYREL